MILLVAEKDGIDNVLGQKEISSYHHPGGFSNSSAPTGKNGLKTGISTKDPRGEYPRGDLFSTPVSTGATDDTGSQNTDQLARGAAGRRSRTFSFCLVI
jgi:hypothetical protein